MLERDANLIFTRILDIGEIMLRSGAEVYRVEDTISRLAAAYGAEKTHVFSIPSNIIATAVFSGMEITHSRRVMTVDTNLELLDRMNDLARRICSRTPDVGTIDKWMEKALQVRKYKSLEKLVIFFIISFSFTVFFGGSWADATASAIIGMILYYAGILAKRAGGNIVFYDLFCAAVSSFLALMSVRLGLAHNADKIIIGNVMLLIPGVELVNGMRDFIAGDIQAGIMHIAEALFLAIIIALGAAGVLTLLGGGAVNETFVPQGIWEIWIIPIIMAAFGSLSFAMFFGICSDKLIFSFLGGALNWFVYLLAMKCGNGLPEALAYALGAAMATLFAEILARVIKTPVTLFIITSVIPMVPGGSLYYTMLGLLQGNRIEFAERGVYTVTVAGSMALGMFSATMLFRIIFSLIKKPAHQLK